MCRYNLRVVECRLAAMVLAAALGKAPNEAVAITTLKEVEPLIIDKYRPGAEAQEKAVQEHLHEGVYTPDEVGKRGQPGRPTHVTRTILQCRLLPCALLCQAGTLCAGVGVSV